MFGTQDKESWDNLVLLIDEEDHQSRTGHGDNPYDSDTSQSDANERNWITEHGHQENKRSQDDPDVQVSRRRERREVNEERPNKSDQGLWSA